VIRAGHEVICQSHIRDEAQKFYGPEDPAKKNMGQRCRAMRAEGAGSTARPGRCSCHATVIQAGHDVIRQSDIMDEAQKFYGPGDPAKKNMGQRCRAMRADGAGSTARPGRCSCHATVIQAGHDVIRQSDIMDEAQKFYGPGDPAKKNMGQRCRAMRADGAGSTARPGRCSCHATVIRAGHDVIHQSGVGHDSRSNKRPSS